MKITMQKIQSSEFPFFISYGIFMFFAILSTSFYYRYFIGTPFKIILVVCFVILIYQEIIVGKYTVKSLASAVLCIISILIVWRVSLGATQNTVILIFIYNYCARRISFEKIANFTILLTGFAVALVIISSYLGIIDNYVFTSNMGRVREYLGFRYALFSSAFVFNITALDICVNKTRIKWTKLIFYIVINLWIYEKTNSRLSFYLALLLIAVSALLKYKPILITRCNLIYRLMIFSFVVCFIGSVWLTVTYNPSVKWQKELNILFEKRLSLGKISLVKNGITLFGQKISWVGNGLDAYGKKNVDTYTYVDNLYIQIIQHYGIVLTVLFLVLFTAVFVQCYRNKQYYFMIALFFMAGHGMVDDLILYLHYNTFWFVLGTTLSKTLYKKKFLELTGEKIDDKDINSCNTGL